jgi:polyisoprenyl-teichoic acid--peptidoglycan teichoic acid transferase
MSSEGFGAVTPPARRGRAHATPNVRRGRFVPGVLDALFPGLGHLAAGRRRQAALFGLPILALIGLGLIVVATTSWPRLAATMLEPDVLWGLLALQAVILLWRLFAVGTSLWSRQLPRPSRRDALPMAAILLVAVVAPQAYAGYTTEVAREALDEIFVEASPPPVAYGTPEPDPSNIESAPPSPSMSPSPSPTPMIPRVNVLLIGVDAGVGRRTYLTDTMIVASLDPVTETVSMVSVPRDMVDVPLPDGRKFRGKINSLVSYARHHPKQFPGSDGSGFDVLRGALGKLLGLDILYHAAVNLGGFVQVIDTLRGIDVNVTRSFCDPTYDEYGFSNGFSITKGKHHLNGKQALAYARVRHPLGESDFTRAARQQEVLSGIRDRIVKGGFIDDPIKLLRQLAQTITTNVPRKILPDLADTMSHVGRQDTYRTVITSPLIASGSDARGSIQIPNLKRITALSKVIFPPSGTPPDQKYRVPKASGGSATTSGVAGCRPAPKPTPKPTKKPTPKPTVKPTAAPTPTLEATPDPTPEPTPAPTP